MSLSNYSELQEYQTLFNYKLTNKLTTFNIQITFLYIHRKHQQIHWT